MSDKSFGINELSIVGPGNPVIYTSSDLEIAASTVSIGGTVLINQVSDAFVSRSTVGTALTCSFNDGPISRTTSNSIVTININNVPVIENRAFNHTLIVNTSASVSVSDFTNVVIQVNGQSLTSNGNSILWLNGVAPYGAVPGYYLFGFSILRISNVWEVLGVFASYS
jgi:hypothetical protein